MPRCCRLSDGRQRHQLDVGRFGHLGLRHLHLNLVRVAADIVTPEIAGRVTARIRGGDERLADIARGHPREAGSLAIEGDLNGRVVQRLLDLHVAQGRDAVELLADLVHEGARIGHVAAGDNQLDRRGAPRLIVCEIRSPGSNANAKLQGTAAGRLGADAQIDKLLAKPGTYLFGQYGPQPLLELEDIDAAPLAQTHAQQAVIGTSAPEIRHVDRELRGVGAGVSHRDLDVVLADLVGDHVERLLGDLGGQLELGPLRRSDAKLELASIDPRKQLAAQLAADDDHNGTGRQQVGQNDLLAVRDGPFEHALESGLDPREEAWRRPRAPPWPCVPCRFSSNHTERTGTNVLESRYEVTIAPPTASDSGTKSARTAPVMMNEGMKTDRMHKSASSRGTAVSMFPWRTERAIDGVCSIWVWMFSISTVASSTRMPMARARPPRVMMLIVLPVR